MCNKFTSIYLYLCQRHYGQVVIFPARGMIFNILVQEISKYLSSGYSKGNVKTQRLNESNKSALLPPFIINYNEL